MTCMAREPWHSTVSPTSRAMTTATDFLPDRINLTSLRKSAHHCRGCDLYKRATQVVFGEGLVRSRLMLVGEMPGDEEDKEGRPFVGPAGRLLDQALEASGINRDEAYVTNVVKHFKWSPKGKRRLHEKPNRTEVVSCIPWLTSELEVIQPSVLVFLGATAAQALLGSSFRVTKERGKFIESDLAPRVTATVHPASVLRQRTSADRERAREEFFDDFLTIAGVLNGS